MKKTITPILVLLFALLLVSGCLTVEKKIYTFKFTGENSGTLTIKYVNIMSVMDDTVDISVEDFGELINSYIDGDQIQQDFPLAKLIDKRLFEENEVLCAEIVFEFSDLAAANLFRYDDSGPFMFCLNCSLDTEIFEYSNGSYGGDIMPVVFWEEELPVLNLTTIISYPDETTISLLPHYQAWSGK